MDNKRKKEDLTPEELWKKVSMQLSNKKIETKTSFSCDLQVFKNEIARITAERIEDNEDFMYCETENSFLNIPVFVELKYPIKKKRKTPSFFPKCSLYNFNDPGFYKKFDLDTLFFIFYYYKGTVQQNYAAIRLKHYAWRYHLKYKMWFQRLDEPKLITMEYEKGEFLFFDYETTWNFMKKNDFVFEYFYLEHNDPY